MFNIDFVFVHLNMISIGLTILYINNELLCLQKQFKLDFINSVTCILILLQLFLGLSNFKLLKKKLTKALNILNCKTTKI